MIRVPCQNLRHLIHVEPKWEAQFQCGEGCSPGLPNSGATYTGYLDAGRVQVRPGGQGNLRLDTFPRRPSYPSQVRHILTDSESLWWFIKVTVTQALLSLEEGSFPVGVLGPDAPGQVVRRLWALPSKIPLKIELKRQSEPLREVQKRDDLECI